MPKKEEKRTILKSSTPSRENWQPSIATKVVRHLKDKAKVRGFTVKYEPTTTDSFKVGQQHGKMPRREGYVHGAGKPRPGKYFGISYKKEF